MKDGGLDDISGPGWTDARSQLEELSASRASLGFTPSETAMFVFSLKEPLFALIASELAGNGGGAREVWAASTLLDRLGLYTTEVHQRRREEVIARQQEELLELSTPVVRLWEGILALPLIGTLDSARTQIVMQSLLEQIVGFRRRDRDHRHHRGADRRYAGGAAPDQDDFGRAADGRRLHPERHPPAIAQTIVHLGLELGVVSKATMADAFALALRRLGKSIVDRAAPAGCAAGVAAMGEIPIMRIGDCLLVTIQVDMHDRMAMALQDDLAREDRRDAGARRHDRHLGAGNRRLVHRPDAEQHRRRSRAFSTR